MNNGKNKFLSCLENGNDQSKKQYFALIYFLFNIFLWKNEKQTTVINYVCQLLSVKVGILKLCEPATQKIHFYNHAIMRPYETNLWPVECYFVEILVPLKYENFPKTTFCVFGLSLATQSWNLATLNLKVLDP